MLPQRHRDRRGEVLEAARAFQIDGHMRLAVHEDALVGAVHAHLTRDGAGKLRLIIFQLQLVGVVELGPQSGADRRLEQLRDIVDHVDYPCASLNGGMGHGTHTPVYAVPGAISQRARFALSAREITQSQAAPMWYTARCRYAGL